MGRERCPNCGAAMGMLQEQRQRAGVRLIRLRWSICSGCHHVALEDWSFLEGETVASPEETPASPLTGRDAAGD
jgi:hypothetical protein